MKITKIEIQALLTCFRSQQELLKPVLDDLVKEAKEVIEQNKAGTLLPNRDQADRILASLLFEEFESKFLLALIKLRSHMEQDAKLYLKDYFKAKISPNDSFGLKNLDIVFAENSEVIGDSVLFAMPGNGTIN